MQEKQISTMPTGDPFIDLGGLVFETLQQRFPQKNAYELIKFVTDVYIEKWHEKLHSVFHTNSKILNPSTKGKHRQNTLAYFKELIEDWKTEDCITGYCKTCGKRGNLYLNSREFFPISGSSAFVNFHHGLENGTYLCNECSIKLFFVPLGVIVLGGQNGFLQPQSEVIRKFWKTRIIARNLDKIAKNSSESILRLPYGSPQNALFILASEIIEELEDENHSEFLQLINFTNFGPNPNCDIYQLPSPVFSFLNKVLHHYKRPWMYFVRRHYRIRGSNWNSEEGAWMIRKKKETLVLDDEKSRNYFNEIYQHLLSQRSILPQLLKTQKIHYLSKMEAFPIEISFYYAKEVLAMEKEQLQLIIRISDVIFELSRKENNFKKYLTLLESAGKAYQLRGALLKIIKAHYQSGANEPLVRLNEYVDYLFPDGQYWGEVRDLLLISLYERMHDERINVSELPNSDIAITEDQTNETLI